MDLGEYKQAYTAYQEAVNIDGRCPTIWLSVGFFYYQINQYRDCLEAIGRGIRLNPCEPLVWRNLGVLVSSTLIGVTEPYH